MTKKKKNSKKGQKLPIILLIVVLAAIIAIATGVGVNVSVQSNEDGYSAEIQFAEEQVPATIQDDMGEILETTEVDGEEVPTVEEVDGGMFKDKDTGMSVTTVEGEYSDLGWSEWYPTDSPESFKNATIGRCIYANNYWGAQCVSLARVFWWSYANRDVSTCGTGMAKGMMNCWQENAGDDFETHWGIAGVQAGDWIIWETGQYGHVAMALGPQNGSYVTILGENQGGRQCEGGGAATNIINLNVNGVVGYYRPKAYIKPAPAPTPEPTPAPSVDTYVVQEGDTLGEIAYALGWYTGDKMFGDDGYAQALAEFNGISNRGLIYPGQVIKRK